MTDQSVSAAEEPAKLQASSAVGARSERTGRPASTILEQYRLFQKQYPEYVVLMQVGDFFEVFDAPALKVSQLLDIGMCQSRYGAQMTGFPVRSMDSYVERLLKEGQSVVLVEQYDSDRALKRKISRIITPGTITEENLLDGRANNFVLAVERLDASYGLAWIDMSTGYFRLHEVPQTGLLDELVRIQPSEIVMSLPDDPIVASYRQFNRQSTLSPFVSSEQVDLSGLFGSHFDATKFSRGELVAATVLLNYVIMTQLDKRPYIQFPERFGEISTMRIDASALRSLEILKNNSTNTRENSLLDVLDLTCTAAGSRLLAQRLQSPLLHIDAINERLDKIEYFTTTMPVVDIVRDLLKNCKDLERCYQRLALNRSTGGPRDMLAIKQTLVLVKSIAEVLLTSRDSKGPRWFGGIDYCEDLISEISSALVDTPSARPSDGGIIRPGYSSRLDALLESSKSIEAKCQELVERYRKETNIRGLKITSRKTLGFLLEVNKAEGEIKHQHFVLDSQVDKKNRYRTSELEALNRALTSSGDEAIREEVRIYEALRERIVGRGETLMRTARMLADLDFTLTMAHLASKRQYTRPILQPDSGDFFIINGRHPVVECKHIESSRTFVHNSCDLGYDKRFAFITGPNMGGKSTFLRQNALIAVMAQCGMYVPADAARIGLVDAVYTRVGASDDLSRDRSTFMVEMSETASILRQATDRSLVIMDEVGRGTAAEEGFALAWGICQYLYKLGCRTLFATHYFRLAELVKTFSSSQSLMTAAHVDEGDLVFLHQIFPGTSTKSHAVDIARLAGIPEEVLQVAMSIEASGNCVSPPAQECHECE